jgi:hypothetical protein
MIEILAQLMFAVALFVLFTAFAIIAAMIATKLFRHAWPRRQAPAGTVPATDVWYYRQRHRQCIQLLVDRATQLSRDLKAAQAEIARLKAYRAS